jgi:hypothetical protein
VAERDDLVQHLESYLGEIAGGWAKDAANERMPFQIVRFEESPEHGLTTYSTLGLSRHVLDLPTKSVRQELVMTVDRVFATPSVVSVLTAVGELVLDRHRGLLRGEVLPPRGALVPSARLDALYAAAPVMLPNEFATLLGSNPPTVFVWLVPISNREADLVATHGWGWFEDQLVEQQPDLYDLDRRDIRHEQTCDQAGDSGAR